MEIEDSIVSNGPVIGDKSPLVRNLFKSLRDYQQDVDKSHEPWIHINYFESAVKCETFRGQSIHRKKNQFTEKKYSPKKMFRLWKSNSN